MNQLRKFFFLVVISFLKNFNFTCERIADDCKWYSKTGNMNCRCLKSQNTNFLFMRLICFRDIFWHIFIHHGKRPHFTKVSKSFSLMLTNVCKCFTKVRMNCYSNQSEKFCHQSTSSLVPMITKRSNAQGGEQSFQIQSQVNFGNIFLNRPIYWCLHKFIPWLVVNVSKIQVNRNIVQSMFCLYRFFVFVQWKNIYEK